MAELTKDYDIYNPNGSVNLTKLRKLKGVDVPRALAEINTFAPKYAGQLTIYQRKVLVDKLKAVNPEFKVKGKSDYKIAEAICEAVKTNPAKCKANYISAELYKVCKVIADMKLTVCHTIAMVKDENGNDVVISLDDFNKPVYVFDSNKNENESEVNEVENSKLDKRATVGTMMYLQLEKKVVFCKITNIDSEKDIVVLEIDGEERKFRTEAINRNMEMQADLEDRWIDQNASAEAKAEVIAEKTKNDDNDDKEIKTMKKSNKTTNTNATLNKKNSATYKKIVALLNDIEEDDVIVVAEELGVEEELEVDELVVHIGLNCSYDDVAEAIENLEEEELDDDDEDETEDDVDDEEDEIDWDEVLSGVSANNLKAMCKKLKVPMSEIKGRTKADLVSIILEYDYEEIEKVYNAIGATSNESGKVEKEEQPSKSSGKYWENETPIESTTEGNIVNYYEEAKKLQVYRRVEKNGEFIKSKGVTIDVDTMSSKDALQMLSMMCYALKDAVEDERVANLVNELESINIEYNTEQYLFSEVDELSGYDTDTLKKMAMNCGCSAKLVKSANKKQLIKLIIDATQKLNG